MTYKKQETKKQKNKTSNTSDNLSVFFYNFRSTSFSNTSQTSVNEDTHKHIPDIRKHEQTPSKPPPSWANQLKTHSKPPSKPASKTQFWIFLETSLTVLENFGFVLEICVDFWRFLEMPGDSTKFPEILKTFLSSSRSSSF